MDALYYVIGAGGGSTGRPGSVPESCYRGRDRLRRRTEGEVAFWTVTVALQRVTVV